METTRQYDPTDTAFRAYVGCRTTVQRQARGRGLEVFDVTQSGSWFHRWTIATKDNPSYLLLDEVRDVLHCVHGDGTDISSFKVACDGHLTLLSTQSTKGQNPVHLALSTNRRWMLVANYATGSVATLPIQHDGALGPVAHVLKLPSQPGPHNTQQLGAHPHQIVLSPCGQWLLVPDKGGDAVHTLALHEATGTLRLVASLSVAPGSGPRHLVFRPDGVLVWVVLELSSQVLTASFDRNTGALDPLRRTSTLPEHFTGENTGAGIVLSRDACHLFVSNRGHGSVVHYDINPNNGVLSSPAWTRGPGTVPRFITHLPSSDTLCVANEDTDNLVCITSLSQVESLASTGSPVCVVFATPSKGTS